MRFSHAIPLVAFVLSGSVDAAPITVSFSGTFTSYSYTDFMGAAGPDTTGLAALVGQAFTGTLIYDPDTIDGGSDLACGNCEDYVHDPVTGSIGLEVVSGATALNRTGRLQLNLLDGTGAGGINPDEIEATHFDSNGGRTSFAVFDPSLAALTSPFDNSLLPTFDWSDFTEGSLRITESGAFGAFSANLVGDVANFSIGTLCGANEHVSSNACVACDPGTTNAAGDDPLGPNTACDDTLCGADENVSSNACVGCGPGTTNAAGDNASGSDTTCDTTLCSANERVANNACVACGPGTTNAVGDDASGPDTACDVAPPTDGICAVGESSLSADCDGSCNAPASPFPVPGPADELGSVDCDGFCNIGDELFSADCLPGCSVGDELGSPVCNGACDLSPDPISFPMFADQPGSVDCNGVCNQTENEYSPECNGVCNSGDELFSWDCDGYCTEASDEADSPDCDCQEGNAAGTIAFSAHLFTVDIFVVGAGGCSPKQLTNDSRSNYSPAWSPDGTKVAFISSSAGSSGTGDIYVMNFDGSDQTLLKASPDVFMGCCADPAWSPDGSRIAFSRVATDEIVVYEIFVMDADGTNTTRLTHALAGAQEPAWSPDGTKIAFTANSELGGSREIYLMNADGSNPIPLTNTPGEDSSPAWSPDGTRIAFASSTSDLTESEIHIMNADGSGRIEVTDSSIAGAYGATSPEWSPDGSRIAFARVDEVFQVPFGVYVMDADGNNQSRLVPAIDSGSFVGLNFDPAWTASPPHPPPVQAPALSRGAIAALVLLMTALATACGRRFVSHPLRDST